MATRRMKLRAWLFLLDRYELRLRGKMARAINAFVKNASDTYETNGQIAGFIITNHKNEIRGLLEAHYIMVGSAFGDLALQNVKSVAMRIEKKAASSMFLRIMREYAATQALDKATRISSTSRDVIQAEIDAGLIEGLGVREIARNIRKQTALSMTRAAVIARTETHNAASYATVETGKEAQQETGIVLKKEWIATTDDRTRPAHLEMNKKPTVMIDELFEVGGEMMDRPGDPSASPENVINCRCQVALIEA